MKWRKKHKKTKHTHANKQNTKQNKNLETTALQILLGEIYELSLKYYDVGNVTTQVHSL